MVELIWSRYDREVREPLYLHLALSACVARELSAKLLLNLVDDARSLIKALSITAAALHDIAKACSFYQEQVARVDRGELDRVRFSNPPHEILSALTIYKLLDLRSSREAIEIWRELRSLIRELTVVDIPRDAFLRMVSAVAASHHQGLRWWLDIDEIASAYGSACVIRARDLEAMRIALANTASALSRANDRDLEALANILDRVSRLLAILSRRIGVNGEIRLDLRKLENVFNLSNVSTGIPMDPYVVKRIASGITMISDTLAVAIYTQRHLKNRHARTRYQEELINLAQTLGIANRINEYLRHILAMQAP